MENGSSIRPDTVAAVGRRYSPVTVAGRIARVDADLRWVQRRLTGSVRTAGYSADGQPAAVVIPPARGPHRAFLVEQRRRLLGELRRWRQVREWQLSAGLARDHGPATIAPGDSVRIRGRWHSVLRTAHRTLTVVVDDGSTKAVAYRMVQDHAPRAAEHVD